MPVDDHPVHPSTQIGKDWRYGCWNRKPFEPGYIGSPWGTPKYIKHTMSTDCRYDLGHNDSACNGCQHRRTP